MVPQNQLKLDKTESSNRIKMEKTNLTNPVVTEETIKLCTSKEIALLSQVEYIQRNNRLSASVAMTTIRTATATLNSPPVKDYKHYFPLLQENRVGLATLARNPNTVLWRKFLLCRSIAEASKVVAIETVVDDPDGQMGVRLALYNYSMESTVTTTDFQDVLPLGVYIIIRNPWFKSTASGGLIIRCDNPADVDIISANEVADRFPGLKWRASIPETFGHVPFWEKYTLASEIFNNLKNLGNKAFIAKRYTDADRFYNLCLEYCIDDHIHKAVVLGNKSAVCLAYGCLQRGLAWAEEGLRLDINNKKCAYRKAKALIELQEFDKAIAFLHGQLKQGREKDKDIQDLMKLAKLNLTRTARLTVPQLLAFTKISTTQPLDDLCFPLLEDGSFAISNVHRKGRGALAITSIPAGTVLLCSKAFAYYSSKPTYQSSKVYTSINYESNDTYTKPGHDHVVGIIANKIRMDPSLGRTVYSLTAGNTLGHLETDNPRNQFVDMKRIDCLVALNCFGTDQYSAIWITPSFFNHSCSGANVKWNVFEDYILFRTTKDIQEGEELLIAYTNPSLDYEERLACFKGHEFQCFCHLCKLDREESTTTPKRIEILSRLKLWKHDDYVSDSTKLDEALQYIYNLRKADPNYNTCLLQNYIKHLEVSLYGLGQYKRCADLLSRCIDVAETVGDAVYGFDKRIVLIRCYMQMSDRNEVERQVKILRQDAVRLFGCLEAISVYGKFTASELMERFGIDIFHYCLPQADPANMLRGCKHK